MNIRYIVVKIIDFIHRIKAYNLRELYVIEEFWCSFLMY